jgi:serine protease
MQDTVHRASATGAVIVASAGNDGKELKRKSDYIPCTLDNVICVGWLDPNGDANPLSNFGEKVDLWAPGTSIRSTTSPETLGCSATPAECQVRLFNGTSAASPFVAGAVGLMKYAHRSMIGMTILQILRSSANGSSFPKVARTGYIDAYRAVAAVSRNAAPSIGILEPTTLRSVSYSAATFSADVSDPERGAAASLFDMQYRVTFSTNGRPLCEATNPVILGSVLRFRCTGTNLPIGSQILTATVIDPFEATATATLRFTALNLGPPTVTIVAPADGASVRRDQVIRLAANVFDPDEHPLPDSKVVWTSSADGMLGRGYSLQVVLSEGQHVITVAASDELGLSAEASMTLRVLRRDGYPTATIREPSQGVSISPGALLGLWGDAADDMPLSQSALKWYSSIDGFLGQGVLTSVRLSGPRTRCNPEYVTHTIRLEVTDTDGHVTSAEVLVNVGGPCDDTPTDDARAERRCADTAVLTSIASSPAPASAPWP